MTDPPGGFFGRAFQAGCRRPRATIVGVAAVLLAAMLGLGRLSIDSDLRLYFGPEDPQLKALDALEAQFAPLDNIAVLVVPHQGDVFQPGVLALIGELTDLGWRVPGAVRVSSLTNHVHVSASGDTISVHNLVEHPEAVGPAEAAAIRAIADAEPMLSGALVAADDSAALVDIRLALTDRENLQEQAIAAFVRAAVDALRARFPDVDILLSGSLMINIDYEEAARRDLVVLVPVCYAGIAVLLWILMGSLVSAAVALLTAALAIAVIMGVYGWLDGSLNTVSAMTPSIILIVAMADAVHIVTSYTYELGRGQAKAAALRAALAVNAVPVIITSITTIIGMLMLNLSDSPPYRDLGNLVAAGVAVALALTFVALPALLLVLPVPHRGSGQWLQRLVQAFGAFVLRRRTVILAGGAGLVVAVSALIPLNRLGEKWYQNLDSRYETRQAIDAISARMGATHAIYYTLDSGSGGGVNEPDYLRTVDAFAAWLEQQPAVEGTAKLTDLVKRMNRVMNGDEPAFYAIPDRRDLVAQYLFLYELFAPPGLGLGDTVDVDRAASRLMVRVDKSDSQALLDLDHRAQEWLRENAPGLRVSVGSGLDMAFAHINQSNIVGLLEGMVLALVLISALVVVFLRSVRLGVVGMLTNLAPAGLAFGIWGLAVGNVDLAASVVMCMSLGIVVDDTVHILSKYLAARRGWGAAPAEAMDYVFRTVGVAVVVTTIVLVVGFLLLLFAAFSPTRTVGLLNSLTIALALAVDLMLVPPILLALDRDGPNAERRRRFTWPDIVTKVGHAPGLGRGP